LIISLTGALFPIWTLISSLIAQSTPERAYPRFLLVYLNTPQLSARL
jgi:hypothetical protein